jgi:hypothetical protein
MTGANLIFMKSLLEHLMRPRGKFPIVAEKVDSPERGLLNAYG